MSAKPLMQGHEVLAPASLRCLAIALAGASALAAGCGSLDGASSRLAGSISPYKVEIVQGNFVSREQVALLQPGMAQAQVRELLGTPLVTSVFHADRWEYVFTLNRQGVPPQLRKLTVFFKGDLLDRTEGDEMPSEAEFVSQIDRHRSLGQVPVLEASEQALSDFSAKNPPAAAPAGAAGLAGSQAAPAVYPPLEAPGSLSSTPVR